MSGRAAPEQVFPALDQIKVWVNELVEGENARDGVDLWRNLETRAQLFSDTIIVTSPLPPPGNTEAAALEDYDAIRRYMLLRYMVLMVTKVATAAVKGELSLLYRGCVGCGEYDRNDFAVLGPAVNETAELYEAADGAFVFLSPSARDTYNSRPGLLAHAIFPYFVEYPIPLKVGKALDTFALNPLLFTGQAAVADVKARFLAAFGDPAQMSTAVQAKFENTRTFLDHVERTTPVSWRNITP